MVVFTGGSEGKQRALDGILFGIVTESTETTQSARSAEGGFRRELGAGMQCGVFESDSYC